MKIRNLETATEDWQRSAYGQGQSGAEGRASWLVRSDYRFSSPFNPELVKWYNAGWDSVAWLACEGHVEDNQGLCHNCGKVMNPVRLEIYETGSDDIP